MFSAQDVQLRVLDFSRVPSCSENLGIHQQPHFSIQSSCVRSRLTGPGQSSVLCDRAGKRLKTKSVCKDLHLLSSLQAVYSELPIASAALAVVWGSAFASSAHTDEPCVGRQSNCKSSGITVAFDVLAAGRVCCFRMTTTAPSICYSGATINVG